MRSDPRPHAAFVKPNLHWIRRERKRGEKPAMPVPNPRLVARPGTRRARIAGTPCVFRARRRNQPTHVRSQERRTSCTPLRYERLEWLAGGASSARGRHRARCRDSCSRRSSVARRRRDTCPRSPVPRTTTTRCARRLAYRAMRPRESPPLGHAQEIIRPGGDVYETSRKTPLRPLPYLRRLRPLRGYFAPRASGADLRATALEE